MATQLIPIKTGTKHSFYNIEKWFDYTINDQNSLTISGLWKNN
jgi:hypothetical protein